MAHVNITNVIIENNPSQFLSPFQLQVTFECLKEIKEEIDWEFIYIGSAKDEKYDQILDSFSMGPLEPGMMQFTLESNPPDYKKIPSKDDILGITAIILKVSFKKQEFFRVGFYVLNQYTDPELQINEPQEILIDKVQRNILANKPRITRFPINWGDQEEDEMQQKENAEQEDMIQQNTSNAYSMFGELTALSKKAQLESIQTQEDKDKLFGKINYKPDQAFQPSTNIFQ